MFEKFDKNCENTENVAAELKFIFTLIQNERNIKKNQLFSFTTSNGIAST